MYACEVTQLSSIATHHSLKDLPKAGVGAINPRGLHKGDVELRAVGVRPCISHAYPSCPVVLVDEILIFEVLSAKHTVSSSTISIGEIPSCVDTHVMYHSNNDSNIHLYSVNVKLDTESCNRYSFKTCIPDFSSS